LIGEGKTLASLQSYFLEKAIKRTARKVEKKLGESTIDERRKKLDKAARRLSLPKNCMVEPIKIDVMYAEWVSFPDSMHDKVVLYLHGGGYEYCSVNTHRGLAARIGKAACTKVLLPEYRLSPEHPFPAAIEDAVQCYRWLLRQGYRANDIVFAGDSAGGGLSLAAALMLRDLEEALPAAIVCLSPWVDLTSSGESYRKNVQLDPYLNVEGVRKTARNYAGKEALDHPLISPVFADFSGFPPLFIQVGTHEILESDAEKLVAAALSADVEVHFKKWDKMWHVWQISGSILPEAKKAITEIGEFVKWVFRSTSA
jgi:monoterpene epsilon-lactone hydrolase